jgi:AcrR family transcriptional regulator
MPSDTKEKLIEAGADLFYTRGFQSVGLDQILTRVGITKTAFYKHFESKDALIIAVLETRDGQGIREMLQEMRRLGGDSPRGQILAMFEYLDELFKNPEFRGCLFMNAATEFPSQHDPIHRAAAAHGTHLSAVVRGLLVKLRAPNPEALTRQIMLLMGGAIASRHIDGDGEAARSAKAAAEALMGRLGVEETVAAA